MYSSAVYWAANQPAGSGWEPGREGLFPQGSPNHVWRPLPSATPDADSIFLKIKIEREKWYMDIVFLKNSKTHKRYSVKTCASFPPCPPVSQFTSQGHFPIDTGSGCLPRDIKTIYAQVKSKHTFYVFPRSLSPALPPFLPPLSSAP